MKSILFLFLYGVALSGALPPCTEEAIVKCAEHAKGYDWPQRINNAEDLERYCNAYLETVECQADIAERCPNTSIGKSVDEAREFRRRVRLMCDKHGEIRKKFLENTSCLNDFTQEKKVGDKCGPYLVIAAENKCKKLREQIKCIDEALIRKCGKDARDVYFAFENPYFTLRQEGCL